MTIAALLLPLAFMQAATPLPSGPNRFEQCVALIDQDAARAYEEGMAWAAEAGALDAYRCAAMALNAQGRSAEAARRLKSLAMGLNAENAATRAELFSQAGNAWLLARDATHARSAFTQAVVLMEGSVEFLPDLLIDRARAYAMERDWRHAEEDLSRAIDLRANDALALRLRASARMHQNSFDLAEADARAAIAIDPSNVDGHLVLGHVRESKRTGVAVEEQ